MTDLIEFLRARLDEDERVARSASPAPWHVNLDAEAVEAVDGEQVAEVFALSTRQTHRTVEHIARHDPARVLREVKAKRRMAELCSPPLVVCPSPTGETEYIPGEGEPWGLDVLKLLALPYADHPDYHPDWRP